MPTATITKVQDTKQTKSVYIFETKSTFYLEEMVVVIGKKSK